MKNKTYKLMLAASLLSSASAQVMAGVLDPIDRIEDTWVKPGLATTYGTTNNLRMSDDRKAYVKFLVDNIPDGETVISATISLMGYKTSDTIPYIFIQKISNANDWDETVLHGDNDNLVVEGDILDSATAVLADGTFTLDVTSAITGNDTYSFMLDTKDTSDGDANSTTSNNLRLWTKTNGKMPVLTIETAVVGGGTDTTAPVITVPTNIIVDATDSSGTAATNADIAAFLLEASAADDVDGSVTVSHDAPTTFPVGETVVTFTATDAASNTSTNTATITVDDNTAPVITLTGSSTVTLNVDEDYAELGATAVDNVDGNTLIVVIDSSAVNSSVPGNYAVTYNVTDNAGNTSEEVVRTISVVDSGETDTTAPVITVPTNISVDATDSSGTAATNGDIATFLLAASADDDVDGSVTVTHDAPATFPLGETIVTFTATDAATNTSTKTATITVDDNTAPVITLTGSNTVTLNIGEDYAELGATAVDNVDGNTLTVLIDSSAVNNSIPGTYVVTYNVTDNAGNICEEIVRTISVVDILAPVITVPGSITVDATDSSGTAATNAAIAAFLNAASASDDVDDSVTVTHDAPTTFPLGETIVTFTATDASNNTSTKTATITVDDNTAPVITLAGSDAVTLNIGEDYAELGATAVDNVDGNTLTVLIDSSAVNNSIPGTYVVTYNVTDNAGNISEEVVRTISVVDVSAPVISVPESITVDATDSSGTAATNAAIAAFLLEASAADDVDDSVTVTHDAPETFPIEATTVTFTATDAANNTSTKTATITIADQTAPVITLTGENTETIALGSVYTDKGAGATDAVDGDVTSDIVVESDVDASTEGTYTVTYTVSDAAGNEQQATRTITVQDAAAPVVTAPSNIIVEATSAAGTANTDEDIAAFLQAATALDEVDGVLDATPDDAPDVFPLGDTVVTFSSTDSQDYVGTSEATITVVDTTAPTIELIGDSAITVSLDDEYIDQGVTAIDLVDGDVTGNVVIVGGDLVDTSTTGPYTITYTAVDEAGNSTETLTRTVTVQDVAAPVVTVPDNITVAAIDSDGTAISNSAISAFLAAATATDNLDGDVDVTDNAPNVFPIGPTTITFSAEDSDGNIGTAQAIIAVADQAAPVITLTGSDTVTLNVGEDYVEQGATAVDNVDGDTLTVIIDSSAVDSSVPGNYTVTYNVTDNATNDAEQKTRTVVIVSVEADGDGDGVNDDDDAFPEDSAASIDTDGDGYPNSWNAGKSASDSTTGLALDAFFEDSAASIDTDGDGSPDNWNAGKSASDSTTGLTALDAFPDDADESLDTDGDGTGDNSDVYPLDETQSEDTTAPVFESDIPTTTLNATGALTNISTSLEALLDNSAVDDVDGVLVSTITGETKLSSGAHEVTISATDNAGNEATTLVNVHIKPLLMLSEGKEVTADSETSVMVKLSGAAATYPVDVNYSISGQASADTTGSVTFNKGELEKSINVQLLADAALGDTSTVMLTTADNAFVGAQPGSTTLTVIETNYAPQVTLTLQQAGQTISVIDASGGDVTVFADVQDINASNTHTYSWEVEQQAFTGNNDEASQRFVFNPSTLTAGSYGVHLTVTENNTVDAFSVQVDSSIVVIAQLPTLSTENDSDNDGTPDSEEGFSDSDGDGILDYLDDNANTSQLALANNSQPLQTLTGIKLSVGSIALSASGVATDSASITAEAIATYAVDASGTPLNNTADDDFTILNGTELINFKLSGLTVGESAPIVYPLPNGTALTADTIYRKYTPINGWVTFVSDGSNSIASAKKNTEGVCPAPLDVSYIDGLTEGDNCIQLDIVDGGVYDADGLENGQVEDPGVLARSNNAPVFSDDFTLAQAELNVIYVDNIATYATDTDNETLTFSKVSGPDWLKVNADGSLSGTPLDVGSYDVVISVTDSKGATANAIASLTVDESSVKSKKGGSISLMLLSLLGVFSLRRRKSKR
jgi:hypothetical protein